jgi:hypothetical protein
MDYIGASVNRPICHSLKSWDTDIRAALDPPMLSLGDYYDFIHNNPAGAVKIGDYLAPEILNKLNRTGSGASDAMNKLAEPPDVRSVCSGVYSPATCARCRLGSWG